MYKFLIYDDNYLNNNIIDYFFTLELDLYIPNLTYI